MDSEPVAAPRNAPLELKLRIMLRNWSYPEFREILYKEVKEDRNHKEVNIYKRIYAYMRALELRKQGLSYHKIREAVRDEISYTPSKNELSYWLGGIRTPLGRMAVFDTRQPKVGLIMGLVLSDGHARQYNYHNSSPRGAKLTFYNKDEGLLEMFKGACHRLGLPVHQGVDQSKLKCEVRRLDVDSTLLYLPLKRYDEFIVRAPADVQWAFIKGLMLGDGSIRYGVLYNTDPRVIETASTLLRVHGIRHSIYGPYPSKDAWHKPMYHIYIRKRSWERFLKLTRLAESPPRPIAAFSVG